MNKKYYTLFWRCEELRNSLIVNHTLQEYIEEMKDDREDAIEKLIVSAILLIIYSVGSLSDKLFETWYNPQLSTYKPDVCGGYIS